MKRFEPVHPPVADSEDEDIFVVAYVMDKEWADANGGNTNPIPFRFHGVLYNVGDLCNVMDKHMRWSLQTGEGGWCHHPWEEPTELEDLVELVEGCCSVPS